MRIDGGTCAETHLDEESGGVVLRRLHPRIASYNDLVIFLLQCNMDIKFIGSGEAAKALLYYVTDYITKPSLPMHVGLSALSYAIQRTNEKFPTKVGQITAIDAPDRARGALTLTVNRMMSRQEISHQQVMSYLVGGGDVYRSHTFRVLHWGAFDRLFKHNDDEDTQSDGAVEGVAEDEDEDIFTISLKSGSVSAASQQQDYVYRSTDAHFDQLCLYEFVGTVEKMTKRSEAKRTRSTAENVMGGDVNDEHAEVVQQNVRDAAGNRRGRKSEPRGMFSSDEHTQYRTHCLRRRVDWTVPVILGDRTPRSDRGEEERESWARMMLILFVPWRRPSDLRESTESWNTAFERQKDSIPARHMTVIANMNVLSECRDVRDGFRDMRRAEALAFLKSGLPSGDSATHTGLDDDFGSQEYQLFEKPDMYDPYENVKELVSSQAALDAKIGVRCRELIDECYAPRGDVHGRRTDGANSRTEDDEAMLLRHLATMRYLKRQRRPEFTDEDTGDPRPHKRRRGVGIEENVRLAVLSDAIDFAADGDAAPENSISAITERVVEEMHLNQNPEQERAFRIVAEHVQKGEEQLLMYIAGVGGTGKTYVIKAIVRFFNLLGR
ncbi:uncharacterized protein TRAVEDRAFT_133805, partial [Trametes versicolor FP-101664 SS1]|uniref:uncharacterized protein n=1 Tax=Trametes versicolor (strain FP-101664) TaxID=717944 RepID=UPI0004624409